MIALLLVAALLRSATVTVGQGEAIGTRSALPLAHQVLPAALRARVVEGAVRSV